MVAGAVGGGLSRGFARRLLPRGWGVGRVNSSREDLPTPWPWAGAILAGGARKEEGAAGWPQTPQGPTSPFWKKVPPFTF